LGIRYPNLEVADRIVVCLAIITAAIGLFEYFFVETYLTYFNIIKYYILRGSIEVSRLEILSTNLFVSGLRPQGEGRMLLPELGSHRVSSLFLEPVSPGNFGVILFAWALVRSQSRKTIYVGLFAMAAFIIVMADSRLGVGLSALLLGIALLPIRFATLLTRVLPAVAVIGLIAAAYLFPETAADNSLSGRLIASGRALSSFEIPNWLGFREAVPGTLDSGYAYVIGAAGIFGFAGFWYFFTTLTSRNPSFDKFRVLSACYFGLTLCISYSPFTIKTAGLLWFLLGALAATSTPLQIHPNEFEHEGAWKGN
jgi:putative polymerase